MFGVLASAVLGKLCFALQKLLQFVLAQFIELLVKKASIEQQLAHGIFESPRDVKKNTSALMVSGQIKRAVQMTFLTTARGFATGTASINQGAAQEGLLGDKLS